MFPQYTTLDQIVQSGGTQQIKQELNAYPLYTWMVRLFGFREIGIIATDEHEQEQGRYASVNNKDGEIIDIYAGFANPSIVVQAQEECLMEILHRSDYIKLHPAIAILQYWKEFKVVQGRHHSIAGYVVQFFGCFAKDRSAHPQSPG